MERKERSLGHFEREREGERGKVRDDQTRTIVVCSIPPAVDLTVCDHRSMAYLDMLFDRHHFYCRETRS